MLKLLDILQEGTLQLTPEERQQVEKIIPDVIRVISGEYVGDNMMRYIADIDGISADKTPIKVKIYVGNDLSEKKADGYYQTNDPKNPTDNVILVQQFALQPYFNSGEKVYSTLTGDKSVGIEAVRRILKHELIHAKDPSRNQHYLKEPYDPKDKAVYYKSWSEFQTMTGQFFEAITTGVDRALDLGMPKEKILKVLNNILKVYSGKTTITGKETLTQDTADFIQGTGKRNIFQALIKFAENTISSIAGTKILNSLDTYVLYLNNIKKYNPEGYKEFLKDLYKTIDQAKDKLNNLKEMKYINEAKRLQQLAGIITEEEYRNKLEEIILEGEDKNLVTDPRILALAAKVVKQPVDKIEDKVDAVLAGNEEENKEEVNESLTITLVAALPMMLEAGGSIAGWVNKKYGLSKEELAEYKKWQVKYNQLKKTIDSYTDLKLTDPKIKRYVENKKEELAKMKEEESKKFEGKIANFLKNAGHGLHSLYTSPIRALLWTLSLFTPKGSFLRNAKNREKIANIMYACLMLGFAGVGIFDSIKNLAGVAEAATALIDGAKGGKSVEEILKGIPFIVKAFSA
jgi:hypothetical protein